VVLVARYRAIVVVTARFKLWIYIFTISNEYKVQLNTDDILSHWLRENGKLSITTLSPLQLVINCSQCLSFITNILDRSWQFLHCSRLSDLFRMFSPCRLSLLTRDSRMKVFQWTVLIHQSWRDQSSLRLSPTSRVSESWSRRRVLSVRQDLEPTTTALYDCFLTSLISRS